jgi:hypothetical protein
VLNSALTAAIVGLLLFQLGADSAIAVASGGVAFLLAFVIQALNQRRLLSRIVAEYVPEYPGG